MVAILSAFAIVLTGFAISGLWWWFAFTLGLLALLGVFELLSVRTTGMTLSQQYTELVRKRPWAGAVMHAIIGAFFGILLYHLATGW